MDALLFQILAGLATGGIYASVALALVMIYQATHLVNFAQGEMAMFSTYIAWTLIESGLPYWVAFAATVTIAFVIGVAIERVIIRPVEQAPVLTVVVVFIGLLTIFHSLAGGIWSFTIKEFPSPFPKSSFGIAGVIGPHQLGVVLVTLIVLGLLFAFFRYTPLGLAMRAAAQNPQMARLVGVRVDWMLALGWGLAASVGAVAGVMVAHIVYLDPNMMSGILLYGFAAALMGGIDNPWGAVIGGFIVGVLENMVAYAGNQIEKATGVYIIGNGEKLTVALIIVIFVLTLKPAGLFGRVVVKRV
jgi:branched-chain amino acid transport system permease protein